MMKGLYAIKDELKGYEPPIMLDNDDEAMRTLKILTETEGSMIAASPEDFSIVRLGGYETKAGTILPEAPTVIAKARSFRKEKYIPDEI